MVDDVSYQLGEIKGLLYGLDKNMHDLSDKVDELDSRLRSVEKKAAINGALSGGLISACVALISVVAQWLLRGAG